MKAKKKRQGKWRDNFWHEIQSLEKANTTNFSLLTCKHSLFLPIHLHPKEWQHQHLAKARICPSWWIFLRGRRGMRTKSAPRRRLITNAQGEKRKRSGRDVIVLLLASSTRQGAEPFPTINTESWTHQLTACASIIGTALCRFDWKQLLWCTQSLSFTNSTGNKHVGITTTFHVFRGGSVSVAGYFFCQGLLSTSASQHTFFVCTAHGTTKRTSQGSTSNDGRKAHHE